MWSWPSLLAPSHCLALIAGLILSSAAGQSCELRPGSGHLFSFRPRGAKQPTLHLQTLMWHRPGTGSQCYSPCSQHPMGSTAPTILPLGRPRHSPGTKLPKTKLLSRTESLMPLLVSSSHLSAAWGQPCSTAPLAIPQPRLCLEVVRRLLHPDWARTQPSGRCRLAHPGCSGRRAG